VVEHRRGGFDAAEPRGRALAVQDPQVAARAGADLDEAVPRVRQQAGERAVAAE
jgi:hypothetical protein